MPNIFKALASVTAWVLFILSWIGLIRGYITLMAFYGGKDIMPAGAPSVEFVMGFSFVGLVLSVVVMVLRKQME
jgi:hypothetical protein